MINETDLIYLATPHSHQDESVMHDRFVHISMVCGKLLGLGFNVYSPISHWHPIAQMTKVIYGDVLRCDLVILGLCKILVVLKMPGWKQSQGVTREVKDAQELGIPILLLTYPEIMEAKTGEDIWPKLNVQQS